MVRKTGKEMFTHLINSAKEAHLNKYNDSYDNENKSIEIPVVSNGLSIQNKESVKPSEDHEK